MIYGLTEVFLGKEAGMISSDNVGLLNELVTTNF